MTPLQSKMNKLRIGAFVALVILVGIYLLTNSPEEQLEEEASTESEMAGWQTYIDDTQGISFNYPPNIPGAYVHEVDWPPQVERGTSPFSCTEAGVETERAGRTEKRVINGRDYCITKVTEGAAGSIYTLYAYATKNGDQTLFFSFGLSATNCANYDEVEKKLCEEERANFDIDQLIDQIVETVVFK